MEIIDNISKTLKNELSRMIKSGSKVAIAASCFSMYAFTTPVCNYSPDRAIAFEHEDLKHI